MRVTRSLEKATMLSLTRILVDVRILHLGRRSDNATVQSLTPRIFIILPFHYAFISTWPNIRGRCLARVSIVIVAGR